MKQISIIVVEKTHRHRQVCITCELEIYNKMETPTSVYYLCSTLLALSFCCLTEAYVNVTEENTSEFLKTLIPHGYDKNIRPLFGGKALKINVSIVVDDINAISEQNMV